MFIVITTTEKDEATGKESLIASHGVDVDTGVKIILPPEHPLDIGATFDTDQQCWVVYQ